MINKIKHLSKKKKRFESLMKQANSCKNMDDRRHLYNKASILAALYNREKFWFQKELNVILQSSGTQIYFDM